MQTNESAPNVLTLPPDVLQKLQQMQKELGTDDLCSALDKSLNIAHFVADAIDDPERKVLIERNGKFLELKGIV